MENHILIKLIRYCSVIYFLLLGAGCSTLERPTVVVKKPISGYKYVYISQMNVATGRMVNPYDIISGELIKKGFVVLPGPLTELPDETLIVNFGESALIDGWGSRSYQLEITLHFIDCKSNELVCTVTASGKGTSESHDIRLAIRRAFFTLFETYRMGTMNPEPKATRRKKIMPKEVEIPDSSKWARRARTYYAL